MLNSHTLWEVLTFSQYQNVKIKTFWFWHFDIDWMSVSLGKCVGLSSCTNCITKHSSIANLGVVPISNCWPALLSARVAARQPTNHHCCSVLLSFIMIHDAFQRNSDHGRNKVDVNWKEGEIPSTVILFLYLWSNFVMFALLGRVRWHGAEYKLERNQQTANRSQASRWNGIQEMGMLITWRSAFVSAQNCLLSDLLTAVTVVCLLSPPTLPHPTPPTLVLFSWSSDAAIHRMFCVINSLFW